MQTNASLGAPIQPNGQILSLTHGTHSLAPAPGFALFAGYCLLALAIAAVLLVRRDTY